MKVGYTFLNNNNPDFFKKSTKDIPASANVKISLRQQVKSTNFKLAEKRKKLKNVNSADASSAASSQDGNQSTTSQDGNSTTSSQDDTEQNTRGTSDYKNEDDLLEAVQQIVEENAIKDGMSGPDQEYRKD